MLSTARPRADNGSSYLCTFTFGYVEARLKLVATQGFFTAFWMLPADTSYVYRSEIIILDLMVDNSWQRSWNRGLLDSTLTRSLEVDYIRVFQQH